MEAIDQLEIIFNQAAHPRGPRDQPDLSVPPEMVSRLTQKIYQP